VHKLCDDLEDVKHWRAREVLMQPKAAAMWKLQTEVTDRMRLVLVEWMCEVCEEFALSSETFFLAVNYLDRYMSRCTVPRRDFQLLGLTCLWVAAKYEEVCPPSGQDMVDMTRNSYSCQDMRKTERQLLQALGFELSAPTALRFLEYYCCKGDILSTSVRCLATCLLELSLLNSPGKHGLQYQQAHDVISPFAQMTKRTSDILQTSTCSLDLSPAPSCSSDNESGCSSSQDEVPSLSPMGSCGSDASCASVYNSPSKELSVGASDATSSVSEVQGVAARRMSHQDTTSSGRPDAEEEQAGGLEALPSHLAAAALYAALEAYGQHALLPGVLPLSKCSLEQLQPIVEGLRQTFSSVVSTSRRCVIMERFQARQVAAQQARLQQQLMWQRRVHPACMAPLPVHGVLRPVSVPQQLQGGCVINVSSLSHLKVQQL